MIESLKLLIPIVIVFAIFMGILLLMRKAGIKVMIPYTKEWWEEWRKNR